MEQCTPVALPAVTADFCAPDVNFGEIDKIYIGNANRTSFTDWTTVTEWNTVLDNADVADVEKIRTLHVVADKPAPERTQVDFSQGRRVFTDPSHTINVTVDETGDTNYSFLQFLESNPTQQYKIWYQAGKYLYGGNDGISAGFILDDIIPGTDEELNTFQGTVTWDGLHPDRAVNPLA